MIGLRQPWQSYNRPWVAHTVRQRRALNVIISLAQYTWSGYIGCNILSSPFERIHDQTMLIMEYYHVPMTEQMIGQRRALHANMALGKRTRSDNVGCKMPSLTLDRIHDSTKSAVASYHSPWKEYKIGRCQVWYYIIALGKNT